MVILIVVYVTVIDDPKKTWRETVWTRSSIFILVVLFLTNIFDYLTIRTGRSLWRDCRQANLQLFLLWCM